MKKRVDSNLIDFILKNWDNPRYGEEVHEIVEAIVAEIKQDYREQQRRHGRNAEAEAFFESLIGEVQSPDFWDKIAYMLGFEFDY